MVSFFNHYRMHIFKKNKSLEKSRLFDVPKRIRTSDLQFRKLLLYPAELSGQVKEYLFSGRAELLRKFL